MTTPAGGMEPTECERCGRSMSTPPDLEPTAYCNNCAQEIAESGRASTATASPPVPLFGDFGKLRLEHLTERSALQPEAPCEDLAVKALAELVACKDLKEQIASGYWLTSSTYEHEAAQRDYERRKGPAWAAAREALAETQRSSHTAESDEQKGVGVRVGATPEPLTAPKPRADNSSWHGDPSRWPIYSLNDMIDFRAALRAPEPLTAEPFARVKVERKFGAGTLTVWTWLRGHIDQLPEGEHDLYTARASLEGGVSPQPSSSVHQTENAGEAVQRPVDVPLSGTTTIPLGTLVGHDMAHFRWPANKDAPTDPDTEFEIQLSNNDMFVRLTADGFGAKGAYRNGALLVSRPEWERSWIAASGNVATARSDKTEIEGGVSRTDLCTLCNALIVPRNPTHYDPEDMKAAKVRAALLVSRTEPALTDELCAGLLACAEMLRPHLEAEARSDDYAVSKSANRRLDGLRHYEQIARRGPK